ncbi:hypothetical protein AVEN_23456-1 [Araneus ventricosus]|uniref:Uncharacterized protein n=1 Tax=Araneus ventricosus TaxID=182803 RepID=A0A4Y2EAP1_ARAVE|nr:hypothetical protein AVEN_23456-1 [Araneus ventricosus]
MLPHQDESSSDFSVDELPQPFSQSELNNLVRDLGLSKDEVELLGSRLKNKNLLAYGTSFSWCRHREKEFTQFFSEEGNLVLCNDAQRLKKCFDIEYDPSEWRLFIDSSKTSLKAVLLVPTVKSLTIEGQTSWTLFKNQFVVVSSTNEWTNPVKASHLLASLRGSAAEALPGIPADKLADLTTIERALESRFRDSHLAPFY